MRIEDIDPHAGDAGAADHPHHPGGTVLAGWEVIHRARMADLTRIIVAPSGGILLVPLHRREIMAAGVPQRQLRRPGPPCRVPPVCASTTRLGSRMRVQERDHVPRQLAKEIFIRAAGTGSAYNLAVVDDGMDSRYHRDRPRRRFCWNPRCARLPSPDSGAAVPDWVHLPLAVQADAATSSPKQNHAPALSRDSTTGPVAGAALSVSAPPLS